MTPVMIDVRERDEFAAEHVENSINVPLSQFNLVAPGVLNQLREKQVWILCRSGNRAKLALEQIKGMGYSDKVIPEVFVGGIIAWKAQGNPTIVKRKSHLPIIRQVQLIAGAMVFLSTVLGSVMSPAFYLIAGFVGVGLMVAGATGFCGMANLLAMLPWNKSVPSMKEELCQASPSSGTCSPRM